MRLKLLIAVALVAVGVGTAGFVLLSSGGSNQTSQYLTSQAQVTTVAQQAVATGTVAAKATYGLSFGQPPELVLSSSQTGPSGTTVFTVDKVAAKVGDAVTAGQVLASADTTDLKVQLAIAKANLAAGEARLAVDTGHPASDVLASAQDSIAQAQLSVKSAAQTNSGNAAQNALSLQQAQQAVADARTKLAADQAGASGTSDQIASAQDQVDSAQLSLTSAQQNVTTVQAQNALSLQQAQQAEANAQLQQQLDLNKAGVSDQTLAADQQAVVSAEANLASVQLKNQQSEQQAQMQLTQAQQALASAQRTLASLQKPSSTTVAADQTALATAEANLKSAQLKVETAAQSSTIQLQQAQDQLVAAQHAYTTKVGPAAADQVATDQASVASAQLAVTTAQETLDRATIVSPVDGTVVATSLVSGVVAPSGYAFEVQSHEMQVTADFPEADLTSLKVGQPATVTLTATNQTVSGTVAQITPVAATSGSSSVVSYAVVVSLTSSAPSSDPPATSAPSGSLTGVYSGMSAQVAVTTASAADVLAVPSTALVGSSGNYEVRVLDSSGNVQLVPVEVGLVTSSLAQITSGISEGETVITGTASSRSSTSTTNSGGFGIGGFGVGVGGPPAGGTTTRNPGTQP